MWWRRLTSSVGDQEPDLPAGRKVIDMSTTISAQQHHHMPLLASLSVAGIIAAAGVVGVVWHEPSGGGGDSRFPAVTQPGPGGPNALLAERGTQSQSQVQSVDPNARIAERGTAPNEP